MAFPDFSKPFILDTDASSTGLDAVLSQFSDGGTEYVVAYWSPSLSKPERQLHMLATAAKDHSWSWKDHLKTVCFAYNTTAHSTTNFTPFYFMSSQLIKCITQLQIVMSHRPQAKVMKDLVSRCRRDPLLLQIPQ